MSVFPAEGKLVHITEAEAHSLAAQSFAGKAPRIQGNSQAIVLHGAPGSGKTTHAWQVHNENQRISGHEVFVAYDEYGALYQLPGFQEEIRDAKNFSQRHAVWDKYRADSQFVRTLVLEKAVADNYDIVADVTSSGGGARPFIEALQEMAYNVSVHSVYAPFDDCAPRFLSRERPGSAEELVSKRIGAMKTLPVVAQAADTFYLHYNPDHTRALTTLFGKQAAMPATQVASMAPGGMAHVSNAFAFAAMLDDMVRNAGKLSHEAVFDASGRNILGYNVMHGQGQAQEQTFVPLDTHSRIDLRKETLEAACWAANTFGLRAV